MAFSILWSSFGVNTKSGINDGLLITSFILCSTLNRASRIRSYLKQILFTSQVSAAIKNVLIFLQKQEILDLTKKGIFTLKNPAKMSVSCKLVLFKLLLDIFRFEWKGMSFLWLYIYFLLKFSFFIDHTTYYGCLFNFCPYFHLYCSKIVKQQCTSCDFTDILSFYCELKYYCRMISIEWPYCIEQSIKLDNEHLNYLKKIQNDDNKHEYDQEIAIDAAKVKKDLSLPSVADKIELFPETKQIDLDGIQNINNNNNEVNNNVIDEDINADDDMRDID